MTLTFPQRQIIKAYIDADPVMSLKANNTDGAFEIAALLNVQFAPDYYVWSTRVLQSAIVLNGFDWVRVDNLSVGKARIWDWLFDNPDKSIDASKSNVRGGIMECWKGTQADLDVRLVALQHCQRLATIVEKLVATGGGTATTVNGTGPSTMGAEGPITYQDVVTVRSGL